MSWRTGSKLFLEIWPAILRNIPDRAYRIEFTAALLEVFAHHDMDPNDVADVHPDLLEAVRIVDEPNENHEDD